MSWVYTESLAGTHVAVGWVNQWGAWRWSPIAQLLTHSAIFLFASALVGYPQMTQMKETDVWFRLRNALSSLIRVICG
jgi:hypothetical protein